MNEADLRREIYRMAHQRLATWPITQTDTAVCPNCHTKIKPPIGRPDILVLNPWGRAYVVEMKALRGGSFAFDQLEAEQRKWLGRWLEAGGLGYLGVGTLERPRRMWLIDWEAWLQIEARVGEYQQSLPLTAGKGYLRQLQEQHLDFDHLCPEWECTWVPNQGWELPDGHSLRRLYESRPCEERAPDVQATARSAV